MADFDTDVALQARGYNPQDAVAPLQAYMLAQQGKNFDTENQLSQLKLQQDTASFNALKDYSNRMKVQGADPVSAAASSGLAINPDAQAKSYTNAQSGNVLNALKSFSQNPSDISPLARIGPDAFGQGATAQQTQVATQGVNQDVEEKKANLRGQIGLGYLQNPTETGWHTAVAAAKNAGLINDLQVYSGLNHISDPDQRMGIARQWAAAGTSSVVNSGTAAGNIKAAEFPYDRIIAGPTDQVMAGPAWTRGPPPPGGFANPAPTSGAPASGPTAGRSAATDDTPAQPSMMTQAEAAHGLPSGFVGRTIHIESKGDPNARSSSGAKGLMQIVPSTWAQYARPGQNPYNPTDSVDVGSRVAADYQRILTRSLGRAPTGGELYLAFQQGPGGAIDLLSNPNARAADIVGAKAIVSNGGSPSVSAGAFANMWINKFNGQGGGNFSLSGPSPMGRGVSMPPASPTIGLPAAGMVGLRAAAPAPPQPDLAPPAAPIPAPSSTQPMPSPQDNPVGRSASPGVPPTAPLTSANPNAPVVLQRGMTPFQLQKQTLDAQRAVSEEESARNQFISANDAQRGLMQLQEDLSKLTPGANSNLRDTLLAPGTGADTRIGLAKTVNSLLSASGNRPLFDPDKIAAAESAQKTSGRLGFDLAGGLGKGEAGYIVNQAIGLNPSVLSTPQGAKLLIGSLMATQQRQKDLYLYQRQYAENNGGNPIGAETVFDESHPPMSYVQDAQHLARVPLQSVKVLQQNSHRQIAIDVFNKTYGAGLARYYLGSRTD